MGGSLAWCGRVLGLVWEVLGLVLECPRLVVGGS